MITDQEVADIRADYAKLGKMIGRSWMVKRDKQREFIHDTIHSYGISKKTVYNIIEGKTRMEPYVSEIDLSQWDTGMVQDNQKQHLPGTPQYPESYLLF